MDALLLAELGLVAAVALMRFRTGEPIEPALFVRPLFLVMVAVGVNRGLAPWHVGYVLLGAESLIRTVVEAPLNLAASVEVGLVLALGLAAVFYHRQQGFEEGFSPTIGEELWSLFLRPASSPTPRLGLPIAEARADLPHLERRREHEIEDGTEEVWISATYGHTIVLGVVKDRIQRVTVELAGEGTATLLACLRATLSHQAARGFRVTGRTPRSVRFSDASGTSQALWTLPRTLTLHMGDIAAG